MSSTLARSQFFFIKNNSILSITKSCSSSLCKASSRQVNKVSLETDSELCRQPAALLSSTNQSQLSAPLNSTTKRLFSTNSFNIGIRNNGLNNHTFQISKKKTSSSITEKFFNRGFSSLNSALTSSSTTTSAIYGSSTDSTSNPSISFDNSPSISKQESGKKRADKPLVNSSSSVGWWLLGTSGLVFGIVVLGGLTRLTESGLSITEWKPVTGTLPPLNEQQWIEEFEKYKLSPEFIQLNSHIDLDDFKFIFFMEWFHRLWGRAIGVIMIAPSVYFFAKRKTSRHINRRMVLLTALLGLQGVIGWWMVYSGLDQAQLDDRKSKPTVSQYRLTTHLGAAFLLYIGMFWTGLEILRENSWINNPKDAVKTFQKLQSPLLNPIRKISIGLVAFTFITAMTGGMVAGLDAGLIYNTFPKMGETWLPSSRELWDLQYTRKDDKSDWFFRNLFDNPTTVQLHHRVWATVTFFSVVGAHMYVNKYKAIIPKKAIRLMHGLMGIVTAQAALGITTLIYLVPISLGALHQAGAVALLTVCLAFAARLRKPRFPIILLINNLNRNLIKKNASKIKNL
ncbi:Cox15p [Ascoidea rubescens DSM 1968]|uniref:COX15-CtaA-domain-containing protein n=1 Tax=Ascoidea rubescens DSM 1968 TaxID=1344418 RepID=A0A1D2VMH5_9ASCO|nr:COX15-CtaA-domain-containing protein [Ascoidea rubescens DSM 1968]ODV62813.1 COX15-CtaA-domain-containing protein [Ascoidea rubescens DSM 1968]